MKYHTFANFQPEKDSSFQTTLPLRPAGVMQSHPLSINPKSYSVNSSVHSQPHLSSKPIPITINNNITNTLIDEENDHQQEKIVPKKKKSKKDRHSTFDFNSNEKPPYSYATLIGISILTHENKRLTLSQIYNWISNTFKYYKREDVGWQNSIRHNLSLNKAFVKGEKSKDGKGHFWCIKPGFEDLFLNSKLIKKTSFLEVMEKFNNSKSCHTNTNIPSSPVESSKRSYEKANNESSFASIDTHIPIPSITISNDDAEPSHEGDTFIDSDGEGDDVDLTRVLPEPKRQKLGDPFWELPKTERSNVQSTPNVRIESSPKPQLAGKNLTYTSSFSCNSNFELSPIRPNETGPLLEPITPGKNMFGMIQPSVLPHIVPQKSNSIQRTPKQNIVRTPMKIMKTPQSGVMKKLWNSPSYLEEFYYSPIVAHYAHHINSYDDDDMIRRNLYPSPQVLRKLGVQNTPVSNSNISEKLTSTPVPKKSVLDTTLQSTVSKCVDTDGTDEDD
jgi:forkhead transcription factor HCM1